MTRSSFLRTILCSVAFSAMDVCGMRPVRAPERGSTISELFVQDAEKIYGEILRGLPIEPFSATIQKQPFPTGMGENIKHIERP